MRVSFLIILLFLTSCNLEKKEKIIGVKIYDYSGDLIDLFSEWNELGINHAFVSPDLARKPGFMKLGKEHKIKIFLIVPTFFKAALLDKNPDLYAIKQDGSRAIDEWVQFVCPNREKIKDLHLHYLKALVQDINPDGMSIDFIRHFVFWEKVYPEMTLDQLPNTCFDSLCVARFEKKYNLTITENLTETSEIAEAIIENHIDEWTDFKTETITSYVKDIVTSLKKINPDILVNLHAVPWRADDFDNAIKKVAGQDIEKLARVVDYVSPMCYSHMVKQNPEWIHDVTVDFETRSGRENILPSIQVGKAYLDEELTLDEFRECYEASLKEPSNGVIFWSWDALIAEPEKKQVVKDGVGW